MHLNKVNLCWVLSDGRPGHEIQSHTLAKQLASSCHIHRFVLRQPWATAAPRLLPGMAAGLAWQGPKPEFKRPPEILITTGRTAAAVGKYVGQRYHQKQQVVSHIQILDPKDRASNYTWLLLPEHDQREGQNIINFTGSIHPFDADWFAQANVVEANQPWPIAVILGNPPKAYFKQQWATDLAQIRLAHGAGPLLICGSPRLSTPMQAAISQQLHAADRHWFSAADGDNPYQTILRHAQHIYVTADSINMMNECAASDAAVSLLAFQYLKSKKHRRFVNALAKRWTAFGEENKPVAKPTHAVEQILQDPRFQKWLNSPRSSNGG